MGGVVFIVLMLSAIVAIPIFIGIIILLIARTKLTLYALLIILLSVVLTKTLFELGAAFPNTLFIHSEVHDADWWDHPGRREYTEYCPVYFFEFLGFASMLLTPWALGYICSLRLKIKLLHLYFGIMLFVPYYLWGLVYLYPLYGKKCEMSEFRDTVR